MRLSLSALLLVVAAPVALAQDAARGIRLFEAHDRDGARAEFTGVLKRNDGDARAHYYLGRLALLDNDADAAVDHLEHAVKLDDARAEYQLWYGNAVRLQMLRSSALKRGMLAGTMKDAYERAVQLDSRSIDARDMLLDFYGMAPAFMGGDPAKARSQAEAIASVDAMRGHLAFARVATAAGDSVTAQREMEAAIAAAPDSLRPYVALVTYHATAKDYVRAFATLDRYEKRRRTDPYALYQLGRIAALSGQQLARGEKSLRAFLANPPKDAAPPVIARAYLRLGEVLKHQGKDAEARTAIEKAAQLDPWNEEAKKALK